jgi:hypothetical protein
MCGYAVDMEGVLVDGVVVEVCYWFIAGLVAHGVERKSARSV